MPPIYLDNNATTKCDPRVAEAMRPYFCEEYGNAASVTHSYGNQAAQAVTLARKQIAAAVGGASRNIALTSGATEANNLAILGAMRKSETGSHLIVSAAEHKAVLDPAMYLRSAGYEVTVLPVDRFGMVSANQVGEAIQPNTKLVSVIAANNEVGSINPVAEIADVCNQHEVLFHTDATQLVGKLPFDAKAMKVDLLSFASHKIYGPKGIGALYIRRGLPKIELEPLIFGGGHEKGLRSGTIPVPLVVGFGKACELAQREMKVETARLKELQAELFSGLKTELGNIEQNGHPEQRLPGNLNLVFDGVNSEALMAKLNDHIAMSSGSACTTADPEPSHVLVAMGLSAAKIRSTVRIGLGRFNRFDEIGDVVEQISTAVQELRKIAVG